MLDSKRKNGEFVNNYCPYGYKKCTDDHNKIEIDEYAAEVVKDIFNYIINGYSLGKIAEKLNESCIKTPMDYRIENGERISANFRKGNSAKWSQNIVRRIAENPVLKYRISLQNGLKISFIISPIFRANIAHQISTKVKCNCYRLYICLNSPSLYM